MYPVIFAILILPIVGIFLLSVRFEPWKRKGERTLHVLGWAALALTVVCAYGLLFARPTTCRVLGGEWHHGGCLNEWGGDY